MVLERALEERRRLEIIPEPPLIAVLQHLRLAVA
jgi:hypothetical protein